MDNINTFSVVVIVCCIACSIISLLLPTGRMNKVLSLVLSLFMLCSMIIPLISLVDFFKTDFEYIEPDAKLSSYDKEYNDLVLKKTADNLVLCADELLRGQGINSSNIVVGLKISDNDSIYVSKIIIYITEEYREHTATITEIISNNFAKKPEIIINE